MYDARVANRYARSLITIAQEDNNLETIYQDAQAFLETCNNSRDIAVALSNPVVPQNKKLNIARKVFQGQLSEKAVRFIQLVIKHQRGDVLLPIFRRIVSQYKQIKGIVDAKVTAPIDLKDEVQDQLKSLIKQFKSTSTSEVQLDVVKDPALLGGFTFQFEDKLIDKSVATQLKNMRKALKQ